jgi:hypothetical protein
MLKIINPLNNKTRELSRADLEKAFKKMKFIISERKHEMGNFLCSISCPQGMLLGQAESKELDGAFFAAAGGVLRRISAEDRDRLWKEWFLSG